MAIGSYTFQTVTVPDASDGTWLGGINNAGEVVGYDSGFGADHYPHAFTYANGVFSPITLASRNNQATGNGINNGGTVVGANGTPPIGVVGFLRSPDGSTQQIVNPAATVQDQTNDIAYGINDGGTVVGADFVGQHAGFVWQNGAMSTFQVPGAGVTEAHGINNGGTIVGTADNYGFIEMGGQFGLLNLGQITDPMDINNGGTVVGSYYDGHWHGFVDAAGQVTTVDAPGAADTWITGENDAGTLVGYFDTATNGVVQGFIATDPPAAPSPAASPPADRSPQVAPTAELSVLDTTTGQAMPATAQPYSGPVAGLQEQYVNITSDNLNMSVSTPNWFIHSGSGTDAIAANSGTNVMDGGTGSNFLTGGNGTDTFFVDDRAASADIWSTVVGFHAGDAATVWGVTPQDFSLNWADGQGASGFTGLTLHATAGGRPTASLTLAGYSSADIGGRLAVSFGSVDGNAYMYIHGNA